MSNRTAEQQNSGLPKLLRAIAKSENAVMHRHDVIFNVAADELDQRRAAAPRLLAALRQLADAVEMRQRQHHCPGFYCIVCTPFAELNEARDAIDQAEGTP